jgi:hypothetical protein
MALAKAFYGRHGKGYVHALMVCVAAGALLFARSTAPVFHKAASVHTVNSEVRHDQRPRFVDNAPQCFTAAAIFAVSPQLQVHARLTPAGSLVVSFPLKGLHYNRPPPIL